MNKQGHQETITISKNFPWNVNFFSIYKRVAGIIIKLNKRYKIKVLQVYASTSTHSDEEVEQFYVDVKKKHFSIVMDF